MMSPPMTRLKPHRFIRFTWTEPVRSVSPQSIHPPNARLKQLVQSNRLDQALNLFDEMPHRDEVTYATLLSGHLAAGEAGGGGPSAALALFRSMLSGEPRLAASDPYVLSLALKASASGHSADASATLHAFAFKSSSASSVFVSTALVDAYSKNGLFPLAFKLFDEMPQKNVVSWTTLIAALIRAGRRHDGLRRFAELCASGIPRDSHSYAVAVKACADAGMLARGREVHAHCAKIGLDATPYVANALASMYARCGHLDCALACVSRMRAPDVAALTTVIASYVRNGRADKAVDVFVRMHGNESDGAMPNEYTYAAVLAACTALACAGLGEQLHAHVMRRGFAGARSVANALVTLYTRVGRLVSADAVFHEGVGRDVISWSAIISGYAQEGLAEEAFALFKEMRNYSGCPRPNEFTLASLLSVCAHTAVLDAGRQLHAQAVAAGLECHAMVRSALIDMYGKSGSMKDAEAVFSNRTHDDVVSWTAMIVGYAEHGRSKEALELFKRMCHSRLKPDHVAFIGVLTACCHAGAVELGLSYLNAMKNVYGLEPAKEHYGCVVDLLGRAGRIKEAEEVIGKMAVDERDGVVWTALLRACAARGEEETGKRAADRVMEAEPWGSGVHVAMANLYAVKGRWGQVAEERWRMRQKGVVKGAGWSSVMVGGDERGVGVFVAGDRRHPRDEEIYRMLGLVDHGARMAGYVSEWELGTEEGLAVNG